MAFFGSPYPREQAVRAERLDDLTGKTREEWDPFFRLDTEFYRSLGEDHERLADAMDRYAL